MRVVRTSVFDQRKEKAFEFLRLAERPLKPRDEGITEVRDEGLSLRQLEDLLEVGAEYFDILKMAAGTQRLLRRDLVKEKIKRCHDNYIEVSTGGLLERVTLQGSDSVGKFLDEAKSLEYDIVEVSSGVVLMSLTDKIRLMRRVISCGFKAKPEVSQTYGISVGEQAPISPEGLVNEAEKLLEEGAWMIMIESEGITENVQEWKTDVVRKITSAIDIRRLLFEAADPEVFDWYIRNFGPKINLFVDSSQVIKLEYLRSGLWGKKLSWGRVVSYGGT
jgi:phosphosulfolactate synthase (CoM biosynthesis protein A)